MKTKTRLKTFIVEFTSNNPVCPRQIKVVAEDQTDALQKALAENTREIQAKTYTKKTDPNGAYGTGPGEKPWAFFAVSVDEGV